MISVQTVEPGTITRCVEKFLNVQPDGQASPGGRERSWDFCFNYFQAHPEPTQNLELSCLQLGYYLASWGMLRGSSYLFRKTNSRHYKAAIEIIEARNPALRDIDADDYADPADRQVLLDTYSDLYYALLPEGGTGKTLVTKVMMGVWGNVPSFDTYFLKSFRSLAGSPAESASFRYPNDRSLALLDEFYAAHDDEIDGLTRRFTTTDFATGLPTDQHLTRMKIIDMFGFQSGYDGLTHRFRADQPPRDEPPAKGERGR